VHCIVFNVAKADLESHITHRLSRHLLGDLKLFLTSCTSVWQLHIRNMRMVSLIVH
jgi:hypothetical protein